MVSDSDVGTENYWEVPGPPIPIKPTDRTPAKYSAQIVTVPALSPTYVLSGLIYLDLHFQRTSVLCCSVLCCAVLCCAVLCCAAPCCAVMYYHPPKLPSLITLHSLERRASGYSLPSHLEYCCCSRSNPKTSCKHCGAHTPPSYPK